MDKYFANYEGLEVARQLMDKVGQFKSFILRTGRLALWQKSYRQYHIGEQINGGLVVSGDQGEVLKISVNDYRNLLLHIFNLVIQQQISYECRATNTDAESTGKTILGQEILEYYTKQKKVRRYANDAAEYAGYLGEGFVSAQWDPNAGDIYNIDPMTGKPVFSGDIVYNAHTPNNVIRDVSSGGKNDWYILRTYVNKYDLASVYEGVDQNMYDSIVNLTTTPDITYQLNTKNTLPDNLETDLVEYYTFLHAKTPACPEGRLVEFLNDSIVISDGGLPYKNVPVWKIEANHQTECPFGYTVAFDLLPMQDISNALHSTCATAARAGGLDVLVADHGSGIRSQDIAEGLRILHKNPGTTLEKISLSGVNQLVMDYMKIMESSKEAISGVNSESRGRIEREISGSALALLHQITVTYMSQYEEGYRELNEDIAQGTLEMNQIYAESPRVAQIGGKGKAYLMQQWNKKDLEGIVRVTVEAVNAQSKTYSGRLELARNIMQIPNAIRTPQDYLMVIETGKVDHLMEDQISNQVNVKLENELMAKGEKAVAIITDDHKYHIIKHSEVLASPDKRNDPNVVRAFVEHMMEHVQLSQNPSLQPLFMMLGYQTPPPPMPPQGMPPSGGEQPKNPNLPQMPKNPMNGERYSVQ